MNKKLIAILTLVMFALTLLPMGAFAASDNTVSGYLPTVTSTNQTGTQDLANIRISQDGVSSNFGGTGGAFTIDLPSGVEFTATSTSAVVSQGYASASAVTATKGTMTIELDSITLAQLAPTGEIVVPLKGLKVTTLGTGDILATISDLNSGVSSNSVVVGRFSSGSASVKAMSTTTTGESAPKLGTLRFTENSAGALDKDDTIKLKLPKGATWDTSKYSTTGATAGTDVARNVVVSSAGTLDLDAISADERTLTYKVATKSSGTQAYEIDTYIVIDDSELSYGDINVAISGTASLDQNSVKIGAYQDFGITVSADTAEEVLAGRQEVDAADIKIKEAIKASILSGRDIKVTLPEGVYFHDDGSGYVPNIKNVKNTILFDAVAGGAAAQVIKVNDDFDEIRITVNKLSTSAAEFKIENIKLDVTAGFSGDVVAKVTGAAGVEGEVVIATVTKPVSMSSEGGTVAIGKQSQEIGDIVITELKSEALISGKNLELTLPSGSTWSSVPTIEVVEGDLDLGTANKDGRVLTIPVKSESYEASTIKLSNVKVSTDRTIAEGDMKISIKADAAVLPGTSTTGSTAAIEYVSSTESENTLMSVKVATVTTPAEDGVVQPVVMTVGSTVYTIDGVEMTMDVAPYIKDARTYFPVRYVAQALGITGDNVVWDGAQRTVTIFRANRIVQVTIGSTTMLVNGVPLTMDVAPEITAERTMLPIRFVAQGLGVNVNWDAATQTITLN